MVLDIIGTLEHDYTLGADSELIMLKVGKHRGLFRPKGSVEIKFDKEAAEDLYKHCGGRDKFLKERGLEGKTIYIIIK